MRLTDVLRRLPLLLAAVLLVVLVAAVSRAGPYAEPRPPADTAATVAPPTTPGLAGTPLTEEEQARDEENEALAAIPALQGLTLFFVASVLFILSIGTWFAAWWIRDSWRIRSIERVTRGRAGPVAGSGGPEFPAAVTEARLLLEQGAAREAVVACWLLLQRAGQAAGTQVRPSETAAEYATRLSHEQLISESPLRRLADLYREARFSEHPVGAELRAAARRELAVLQAELGSGVRL